MPGSPTIDTHFFGAPTPSFGAPAPATTARLV